MATLSLTIPDALVPDLANAIAYEVRDGADAAAAATAAKIIAGQATTGAERQAMAQAWLKQQAKDILLAQRGRDAAAAAKANASDPAVQW
jgi:hypothetical protein